MRERGESIARARAVCCVARRGKRRGDECAACAWMRRCGDAAPPSPPPCAAAALSACSANAPRAPAPAGTPTASRKLGPASLAADAAPATPSTSSACRSARRHSAPAATALAPLRDAAAAAPSPSTATSTAACTASAAAWFPPAAAMNCAVSRAGRCALSSDDSRPIVQSRPVRAQAAASPLSRPRRICVSSKYVALPAALSCVDASCVASAPSASCTGVHSIPKILSA
eukprot:64982-Pleurochrysis_carterae.AAC.1